MPPAKNRQSNQRWKFVLPAKCDRWLIVALIPREYEEYLTRDKLSEFTSAMRRQFRKKKMLMGELLDKRYVIDPTDVDLEDTFVLAKKLQASFVFFITAERCIFHDKILFLGIKNGLITQEVLGETAIEACGNRMVLADIVQAINIKNGGIAYGVTLEPAARRVFGRNTLILYICNGALERKYTPDDSTPAVFGFCSSIYGRTMTFCSGYRFAQTKNSQVIQEDRVIYDVVAQAVESFSGSDLALPEQLVVFWRKLAYRDFSRTFDRLVPQIQEAYEAKCGSRRHFSLTFIVVLNKKKGWQNAEGRSRVWLTDDEEETVPELEVNVGKHTYAILRNSMNINGDILESLIRSFKAGYAHESNPLSIAEKAMVKGCKVLLGALEELGEENLSVLELNNKFSITRKPMTVSSS